MKKKHRKILCELLDSMNQLGGVLDRTSTHESKLWDRQRAHMLSYNVLYAVLADHPENDSSEDDFVKAEECLKELQELTKKTYPDRVG